MLAHAWQARQRRQVAPMALLIALFCNVNRDPAAHREPVDVEEVLGWLGYTALAPVPEVPPPAETLADRLDTLAEFYRLGRNGTA